MRIFIGCFMFVFAALASAALASPDVDFPQVGESYGGKVRNGPGMQYQQVGSLREGDAIDILNGTGVFMNGYEWFRIRFRGGSIGYQWGGIICSQKPNPGIFQVCANLQPYANNPVPVTPPPATSPTVADGRNVGLALHSGGGFLHVGNGRWHEFDSTGRVTYYFQEQARDAWSVYLFDASRNVALQLDLHRKKILYGVGTAATTDLYTMTLATIGG
jgi:hypothetical protein